MFSNDLTEEEKNIKMKKILEDFEDNKLHFMKEITDNVEGNIEENLKKEKKYTSI